VKRLSAALAVGVLAASGLAAAQSTPPAQQTPPADSMSRYPSSNTPTAPAPGSDTSSTNSKATKKQQVKDCVAQQQANNSGMSKSDAKKYCKDQVNNSPHQ
jgi:hypothetical protein